MFKRVGRRVVALTTTAILMLPSFASADATQQVDQVDLLQPPPGVQFWTDNPNLNAKILSGEVKVEIMEELSQTEKEKIDAELRRLGYPESDIASMSWGKKEYLASQGIEHALFSKVQTSDGITAMGLTDYGITRLLRLEDLSTSNENRINIWTYFAWNINPVAALTDEIGVAWRAWACAALVQFM